MVLVIPTGAAIFGLTLFLDLLEMSFGRILWFMKTLRFWLYFTLHFGISCLAAYLVHSKLPDWFILAPAATFLGVAIISNTNVKLAGISIVPVADLFVSIKTKMIEQAGQDKATEILKAQFVERLRKLDVKKLEGVCSAALIAASWPPKKVQAKLDEARTASMQDTDYHKNILIDLLLKTNLKLVEESIAKWEEEG